MLTILTRILLFLSALWLFRWLLTRLFGGALPGAARRPGAPAQGNSHKTVKDPVCGMYLDPRLAVRVDERKGPVYFCSDECRDKFRAGAA